LFEATWIAYTSAHRALWGEAGGPLGGVRAPRHPPSKQEWLRDRAYTEPSPMAGARRL